MARPKSPPASVTPAARAALSPPEPEESPFADTPDAAPADCETRPRTWGVPAVPEVRGAEWVAKARKPRAKRVDLNPVQRRWFEANGYVWARVETANPWGGVSVDLWGVFDFIAAHPDKPGTLYVQVATLPSRAARRKKVLAAPQTVVLLAAGNRVELHLWDQPKGKRTRWELTVESIELGQL